jgi:hypothetical protein
MKRKYFQDVGLDRNILQKGSKKGKMEKNRRRLYFQQYF